MKLPKMIAGFFGAGILILLGVSALPPKQDSRAECGIAVSIASGHRILGLLGAKTRPFDPVLHARHSTRERDERPPLDCSEAFRKAGFPKFETPAPNSDGTVDYYGYDFTRPVFHSSRQAIIEIGDYCGFDCATGQEYYAVWFGRWWTWPGKDTWIT